MAYNGWKQTFPPDKYSLKDQSDYKYTDYRYDTHVIMSHAEDKGYNQSRDPGSLKVFIEYNPSITTKSSLLTYAVADRDRDPQ